MRSVFLFLVCLAIISPEIVFASSGNDANNQAMQLFCKIENTIVGPLGIILGVSIALIGFYSFVMSGSTSGLVMMVVGALVPTYPSLYGAFLQGTNAAFIDVPPAAGYTVKPSGCPRNTPERDLAERCYNTIAEDRSLEEAEAECFIRD